MKVIRKHTCLKKITKHDDCYVNASLSEVINRLVPGNGN